MNVRSLVEPVNRVKRVSLRVHVASCRGCINNRNCVEPHQHGRNVNQTEEFAYRTSRLLEDLPSVVQQLEAMAFSGAAFFSGSGPSVLAVCMEMLAAEIDDNHQPHAVATLLACWRILGHHCELVCAGGHLTAFTTAIEFTLTRFSPTTGRKVSRQELSCFILAATLASSRMASIGLVTLYLKSVPQADVLPILSALTIEMGQLQIALMDAFGFQANASIADPASLRRCERVRDALGQWALAAPSDRCLTLDASKPFPLPQAASRGWLEVAGLAQLDYIGATLKSIGLMLLSVCTGVGWTEALCVTLVAGTESLLGTQAATSNTNLLPLLTQRLALAVAVLDYRSPLRHRSDVADSPHDVLLFEHEGDASFPTILSLSQLQHRCLVCVQQTMRLLFLTVPSSTQQREEVSSLATALCTSVLGSVLAMPLLVDLLASAQLPLEIWTRPDGRDIPTLYLGCLTKQLAEYFSDVAAVTPQVTEMPTSSRVRVALGTSKESLNLTHRELFAVEASEQAQLAKAQYDEGDGSDSYNEPLEALSYNLPSAFWIALGASPMRLITRLASFVELQPIVANAHFETADENAFTRLEQIVPHGLAGWALAAAASPFVAATCAGHSESNAAREEFFANLKKMQTAFEQVNRYILARGVDFIMSMPTYEPPVQCAKLAEDQLLAPVNLLACRGSSDAIRNLVVHFSTRQSPFIARPTAAPNEVLEAGLIRPIVLSLCEGYVAHNKLTERAAARFGNTIGSANLVRQCCCDLFLLTPVDVARLAAACVTSAAENEDENAQTQNDRALGPKLIDLQLAFPSVRTPYIMRGIAGIYNRETRYYLPDTRLLARIRSETILPWQPDLQSMYGLYRPSFHQAMLLAACALVLRRGLPLEVVLWGIIRQFVPSVLQEGSMWESGASVVNKVTEKCAIV